MKPDVRKLLILNLPYLIFVYLFGKVGQAYRLAAGADLSGKLLHFADGFSAAFANPLPSLHPFDLCIGIAGAVIVRLVVYRREGRSWNSESFHLEMGETLYPEDKMRLAEIQAADPKAVILNSYYCGYLDESMSLDGLAAEVRRHYENGLNDVTQFIEAHDDVLPPRRCWRKRGPRPMKRGLTGYYTEPKPHTIIKSKVQPFPINSSYSSDDFPQGCGGFCLC